MKLTKEILEQLDFEEISKNKFFNYELDININLPTKKTLNEIYIDINIETYHRAFNLGKQSIKRELRELLDLELKEE